MYFSRKASVKINIFSATSIYFICKSFKTLCRILFLFRRLVKNKELSEPIGYDILYESMGM